ncbi:MAG TPA: rhamnulokinase [bacterium]|nr:rhamnulokinase [bacterium]
MSDTPCYLAVDLGASSGRVIQGRIRKNRIFLKELNRFPNNPVPVRGHLYWPVYYLWENILKGLFAASKQKQAVSVGVDAWGVDFGLFQSGYLIQAPHAYREFESPAVMESVLERVGASTLYRWTGIQSLPINTLFQLASLCDTRHPVPARADRLLFMADLFHYWLTGEAVSEITIASTSQLLNAETQSWETNLFRILNLPMEIMPHRVTPGSVLGPLTHECREQTGLRETRVVIPACHDTACAVAAVPAESDGWAFLSSGTWSLLGVETRSPVLHEGAMNANFTNEAGVDGTIRFLRNSMGLWLLQSCIREWRRAKLKHDYETLLDLASRSTPFVSLVDPDHSSFLNPGSMTEALAAFCRRTGQPEPADQGAFVRCILESLALKYRYILDLMGTLGLPKPGRLHIVGGGSRNRMLNQFTADASGLPVLAGPAESTALGNILIQAMALGHLSSLREARSLAAASFEPEIFQPGHRDVWEEAYGRMRPLFQ